MMPRYLLSSIILAAFTAVIAACSAFSPGYSLKPDHPEKLAAGRPLCSECHAGAQLPGGLKPYAAYDHDQLFVSNHAIASGQNARICAVCHEESFCSDCHAAKNEIKQSVKFGNRPDRELIHQGDYLARHRIDGRSDPTGCYSCHGRSNNESCRSCHR